MGLINRAQQLLLGPSTGSIRKQVQAEHQEARWAVGKPLLPPEEIRTTVNVTYPCRTLADLRRLIRVTNGWPDDSQITLLPSDYGGVNRLQITKNEEQP
jgi:hypothetical protein